MATRFYLSSTVIRAGTPPAVTSDWTGVNDHNNLSEVRALNVSTALGTSVLLFKTRVYDAADHLVAGYALSLRFVSGALAAQTITAGGVQAVSIQIQGSELRAIYNQYITWKLFLVNSAGVLTGTVIPLRLDGGGTATTPLTPAAELSAGPSATTGQNRGDSVLVGSPVVVNNGDRLVLEIGAGGLPTAGGNPGDGHNTTLRVGEGPGSTTDLPVDETTAGTTFRPWIEFSVDTITFAPPPGASETRVTQDSIEILYSEPPPPTRLTQDSLELLLGDLAFSSRLTEDAVEVLYDEVITVVPTTRVTQDSLEILWSEADAPEAEPITAIPDGQISTTRVQASQLARPTVSATQLSTARTAKGEVGY